MGGQIRLPCSTAAMKILHPLSLRISGGVLGSWSVTDDEALDLPGAGAVTGL